MLWPREHGAYGQVTLPLVTVMIVTGVSWPGGLLSLAVIAAFLAHEPLVVVIGGRGPRARREHRRSALMSLCVFTGASVACGIAGFWWMPADVRWSVMLPLIPALTLLAMTWAGLEKSVTGEIAAAVAFSLAAIPIGVSSPAPVSSTVAVSATYMLLFVSGTLAVRVVIAGVRGGGDPRAVRLLQTAVLIVVGTAYLALCAVALADFLPWVTLLAAGPGSVAAVMLALHPPGAGSLRTVGWTLVAVSVVAALLLAVGLTRTA